MSTLADIEAGARRYAEARERLARVVDAMHSRMEAIKREYMRELKRAVNEAAEQHEVLRALIEAAPELFVRPRTVVFHGIKVGYQKGKGRIEWDDADRVVQLIRKHYPERAGLLIVTSERPAKEALAQLSAAELKRLGVSVVDAADEVVIRPTDSAVERMVEALLKDATEG